MLTAVLTEIVVIGAVGNQSAATAIANHNANPTTFSGHVLRSLLTYRWRVSPLSGDTARVFAAQWARVGAVLVLTGLLVWAIARGVGGFTRVFFGTWMAVLVATQLGQIVYGLVVATPGRSAEARVIAAFFGGTGPSGATFFVALMLGLLVALLTAIVAMASRRRAGVLMPLPPGTDESDTWLWGDEDYRAAAARSAAERWGSRDWSDPTVAMPGSGPHPGGPPYAGGPQYAGGPPYSGGPQYAGGPPYSGGPQYAGGPPYSGGPQYAGGPAHPGGPPYAGPAAGGPSAGGASAGGASEERSAAESESHGPGPSSDTEQPDERTQAYDFSEDPEFSEHEPVHADAGDQPTQQFDAPPREAGPADTRQMPPVRDE